MKSNILAGAVCAVLVIASAVSAHADWGAGAVIDYETNTKSATISKSTAGPSPAEQETYDTPDSTRTFSYTFIGNEAVPAFEVKHAFSYTDRSVFTTCAYTDNGHATCVEAFNMNHVFTEENSAAGLYYGGTPAGQDIEHNIGQAGGATPVDVSVGLYCRAKAKAELYVAPGSATATVTNASTSTISITLEE